MNKKESAVRGDSDVEMRRISMSEQRPEGRRSSRWRPGECPNPRGRGGKKPPEPYFDDPGQAHSMEKISGRGPKGEKIWLSRYDALRLAMFNKGMKGDVAAGKFWVELNGGAELMRFTAWDLRKTERKRQRFIELLQCVDLPKGNDIRASRASINPEKDCDGEEEASQKLYAAPSEMERQGKRLATPAKRDYCNLNDEAA